VDLLANAHDRELAGADRAAGVVDGYLATWRRVEDVRNDGFVDLKSDFDGECFESDGLSRGSHDGLSRGCHVGLSLGYHGERRWQWWRGWYHGSWTMSEEWRFEGHDSMYDRHDMICLRFVEEDL
jgi:hypothetical protein